jgi:hypothetical protein
MEWAKGIHSGGLVTGKTLDPLAMSIHDVNPCSLRLLVVSSEI